ncbi:MAG TPA: S8 family serine peptidase [Gemmataceae bacterium]|nr:S8 family serine peptidase [Gemmataceae bacterium]
MAIVSSDPLKQLKERLVQLGAARWHAAGFRGQGVKIAILDSGFRGYRAHLGQALPAHVAVRSFRKDANLEAKNSQHGILCGEVLHALAPDAELLLANWDADQAGEFLEAVRWARAQGARIISCSLIMPSWSDAEGGGAVHAALAGLLGKGDGPGDMLCFASAGNTAQRHWSGQVCPNADGFHQWQAGQIANELIPWSLEEISVELCSCTQAHYEVIVHDDTTHAVVAFSNGHGGTGCCTLAARFLPISGHNYSVRVRQRAGSPAFFHIVSLGAWLHHATLKGSIPFPADGPEVIAVGAVDTTGRRTSYSSCGPNSSRPKPDLVAPVPFPSLWRSRAFSGTSASAPQAAGLAALLWSRQPGWSAQQIRTALQSSATDLGPPGHDYETGYGMIRLP